MENFSHFWLCLPTWWTIDHDMLLLKLSLICQINPNKFYETWCENDKNILHRLRYLMYYDLST